MSTPLPRPSASSTVARMFHRSLRAVSLAAGASLIAALGGCWVVLGESFTGYAEGSAGDSGAGDAGSMTHPIDDCVPTPAFVVANGVVYPDHAGPAIDIVGGLSPINTDDDVRCDSIGKRATPPYCLLLVTSFHIANGATFGTVGSLPLVIMTVHDLTIDDNGVLDLAGGEYGTYPGVGHDPVKGIGVEAGAGGGNGGPGAGTACGATGGATIDTALVGGGRGGGSPPDSNSNCSVGGSGGGAAQLVSLCGAITIRGNINAGGGGGGSPAMPTLQECPDGYGGGAGGTVWMQSNRNVVFDPNTSYVDLAGGGGGGGGCRATSGDLWTPGTGGDRGDAGVGGSCAAVTGGLGGLGGLQGKSPRAPGTGANGTGGGETRCGGGGGGAGRLILQAPGAVCDSSLTNGFCQVR